MVWCVSARPACRGVRALGGRAVLCCGLKTHELGEFVGAKNRYMGGVDGEGGGGGGGLLHWARAPGLFGSTNGACGENMIIAM